jgi:hypothetical protein
MENSYERLKIPVHKIPENEDLVSKFDVFQQYKEFTDCPKASRNKVIKYVVFAYDPGSPFVMDSVSDLKKRKEAAAEAAGFLRTPTTGLFDELVKEIMELKNEETNAMIFKFLQIINNRTWTLIVTNEQIFDEYTALLMEPVKSTSATEDKKVLEAANIKSKLREECKVIADDLKKLYKEFFGDNDDLKDKIVAKPIKPETV